MEALDFQIDIGVRGHQGYDVTARGPGGDEAVATMRLPVTLEELSALLNQVKIAVVASSARVRRTVSSEEKSVQELGGMLFTALVAGNVRALLVASRQQAAREGRQLRVVLRVRPAELARLPWEFLFDAEEDDYICLNTPLIRYPAVLFPQRPLRMSPPLRILGLVSRPGDLQPVAIEEEQDRLRSALRGLEHDRRVELHWVGGQSWRHLQDAMRRGPWHVFHFIGHGGFDAIAGEGTLALVADDGRTRPMHAGDLAMLLRSHPSLRLVVLNACDTGHASALDPFSSVAGALVRRGIPAVLAMQFEITDHAAVEFSRTFYDALSDQLPVDVAVTEARQAIRLAVPGTLEWGTPMLYLRSPDGYIFDLTDDPLDALYTQGVAADRAHRWDEAVQLYSAVVGRDATYRDAAARLDRAKNQWGLAVRYAAAGAAIEVGSWDEAIEQLQAVLAADPDYLDSQTKIEDVRREREVSLLHAQLRARYLAGDWTGVVAVGDRLAALDPKNADPAGLVTSAVAELKAPELARTVLATPPLATPPPAARHDPDMSREAGGPQLMSTVTPAGKAVWSVSFSPDGRRLALAGEGRTARLVEVASSRTRLFRHGWFSAVAGVAFSRDGRRLATAGDDRTARIWDADTCTALLKIAQDHWLCGVAFSPDGRWLATAGDDGTARIWDADTGTALQRLDHDGPVSAVAFSPDGRWLATASLRAARIWDAGTGAQVFDIGHDRTALGVAFAPDGGILATTTAAGACLLWRLAKEADE